MTTLRTLLVLAAAMLATSAQAQVEGQDYVKITPAQTPETKGKIEVIEFFSYGCPHCFHMDPLITAWAKELPANAVLVKVPVSLGRREWGQLVRAYYTLQATGDLARLDHALFKAIHEEKKALYDEDSLAAWAGEHGVNASKFHEVFNSFDITTKASRAEQLSRSYKVNGIPNIAVAGKYTVLGKTYEDMLKTARVLVDKSATEQQATNR